MALTNPPLARADQGDVLTVGAWNSLAGGIEGLYSALASAERRCIDVTLNHRGVPVRGARVIATPVDPPGPPLTAVAPIGELTSYAVAGVRKGSWAISIDAPGYAPEMRNVDVAAEGAPSPLTVELKHTTVPAPEIVGMGLNAATHLLGWAQLGANPCVFSGDPSSGFDSRVLMQGPSAAQIAPGSVISGLYAGRDTSPSPSMTIVPELLGFPAGEIAAQYADEFQLTVTSASPAKAGDRVLSQSRRAGEAVWARSPVELRYGAADIETVHFGAYDGIHAKLAGTPVKSVRTALDGYPTLTPFALTWCPWEVARAYVSDTYLAELLAFFADGFGVAPTAAPGEDLEAIWRSFIVVLHAPYL